MSAPWFVADRPLYAPKRQKNDDAVSSRSPAGWRPENNSSPPCRPTTSRWRGGCWPGRRAGGRSLSRRARERAIRRLGRGAGRGAAGLQFNTADLLNDDVLVVTFLPSKRWTGLLPNLAEVLRSLTRARPLISGRAFCLKEDDYLGLSAYIRSGQRVCAPSPAT